ncbi:MAG: M13 family metallopeptidase, partial [Oscillospiraceae bacterium]|nr:M13 family metallopeptidase [Oscillospiraceae bacterium]
SIDSIDALTDYLGNTPLEDQLSSLYKCDITTDYDDSSSYILVIQTGDLMLKDAAEYQELTPLGNVRKDASETLVTNILGKLGYSKEEVAEKIENSLAFETQLAPAMISEADQRKPDYLQKINNHYTREELVEAKGDVPLIATFEDAAGYPEADSYLLEEPDWLSKLNSLYTEENLDLIKDYLIVQGAIYNARCLDRECYEWANEYSNAINGIVGERSDELVISQAVARDLEWPVARLYCETYLSQDDKDRISELIDEIIAEYHGIIEEADFLTDETKSAAIEKLEAIDKNVLWPDDWSKYDSTDLKIASAADGGTLWEAKKDIERYGTDRDIEEYSKPVDKDKWDYIPTTFNCGYDPQSNSIWIFGAYARGDIYNSEMSDEDLYARLGTGIGHEISHAFDSTGAQFDKDGNMNQWWSDEDWTAFQERNEKMNAYFNNIHPWEGQDFAENKTGEACADMGGMKCILRLAAQKDGFDYDKFFRSFTDLWLSKVTQNLAYAYLDNEHPMPYLRVNCTLQQFDEFLDFYGIEEGDTMYLAPEDRVNIW